MKSKIGILACAAAVGLMAACSSSASAETFNFSQGGYSGGGSVSGSFNATDLDHDGHINSFLGEVTGFSLTFSGDAIVGNFTHTFSNLSGLVYELGSGFIGDGYAGGAEGMASNWNGTSGFDFASGLGPTGGWGGRAINVATGGTSTSAQLISVTSVPEPETYAMLLAGLGVMGAVARRRKAPQA